MAYQPRPDGLNDLILDDGTRFASPLAAAQLEELGHQPIPAMPQGPGLPPDALASNEYAGQIQGMLNAPPGAQQPGPQGPPPSVLDAPGGFKVVGEAPTPSGKPRPDFQTGVQQVQAEAPQTQAQPKRDLVPIGAAPGTHGANGYAPQRVTRIKGGDVRASFTRVPGQEVPDDVKRDALNTDAEDLEMSTQAILQQREELRVKREHLLLQQQDELEKQQARRAQIDQQLAAKLSLIEKRDREVERMRPQSAREIWQEQDTLARVGAGITSIAAGIFGGYAAGLSGKDYAGNPVLHSIDEALGDEVAAQRSAYEDAKDQGQVARNDYARAIAMYGTPEAAALDMQMRGLAMAEKILENRLSKIQDQEYLQKMNQLGSQLRQQRAETKMKLLELERGKVTQENWQYVPDRFLVSGGAPKVKNPDTLVRLPNGQYMQARGGTEARAAQGVIQANARLSELAGRLKSLTDTVGKREPTAAERAAAETIKSEMMFTYKDASQAGALDKGLQDAMEGYFGKATNMFRLEDAPRKLDEVKRIADGKVNETVRYNLHPLGDYTQGAPMPPPHESDE